MGLFTRKKFQVKMEEPGRLSYREGNHEYVFPVYEEDGEVVIAGLPSKQRIRFLFGWYWDPSEFSSSTSQRILPRLLEHYRSMSRQARIFRRGDPGGQSFSFYPELFEARRRASQILGGAGFTWFRDYSSLDLLHEEYGLEICGIREESSVEPIVRAMQEGFPHWHYNGVCYKDHGPDPGWKCSIHMFPRGCGGGRCVDAE